MHQNIFNISELFKTIYGEHAINDKSGLLKGENIVVSSQGIDILHMVFLIKHQNLKIM